jgi:uncharacterized protein with ParB-like and HNH nuclease domain
MATESVKTIGSREIPLEDLFIQKFDIDFYQREYVWERKHIEDLIMDLTMEFIKNWRDGDNTDKVDQYNPYFMGTIVISEKSGKLSSIIDGQQRITTLTLLLIYIKQTYSKDIKLPKKLDACIYGEHHDEEQFNLNIKDSFKKIIIVKDVIKIQCDNYGITTMSIFDFLLNENSLDL